MYVIVRYVCIPNRHTRQPAEFCLGEKVGKVRGKFIPNCTILRRTRTVYKQIPSPTAPPFLSSSPPQQICLNNPHISPTSQKNKKESQPQTQTQKTATISFLRRLLFGTTPTSPAAMSAAKTKAQGIIDANPVAVFSKSYCPYCKATKALLSELGAKFEVVELDQVDDGEALQDALQSISNQRTVPNVFIGQKHIGGNSDVQAKKAQLPSLLKEVGAL